MRTYKIKVKAGTSFQNMGKESYSSLGAALADIKELETFFKPHYLFLFCNDRIVCKTGESAGEFRDPFYQMGDAAVGLSDVAAAKMDAHLSELILKVQRAIDEVNEHLTSNYLWD